MSTRVIMREHGRLINYTNWALQTARYIALGFTRCAWCWCMVSSTVTEENPLRCPNCGSSNWKK